MKFDLPPIEELDQSILNLCTRINAATYELLVLIREFNGCCTFPGCHNRRFLHCQHVEHWSNGGETSLDNPVLLCTKHHSLVHEGGFRSVRYRLRCSLPVH